MFEEPQVDWRFATPYQRVVIDFETRSEVDLARCGAAVYAEHPSTEIICLAYQIGEHEPRLWTPDLGAHCPADLRAAIQAAGHVEAHNVAFERSIWDAIMVPRYGWPPVFDSQWRDTMASALYHALPAKLEKAADVLRLPQQKDMEGNRLLKQLSRPKKDGSWEDDFFKLQRCYDYCVQDVRTEVALSDRLGWLPAAEDKVFRFDQKVNQRGIRIDRELCEAAVALGREYEARLTAELAELTNGEVTTANQRDRLMAWALRQGVDLPDMTADTVREWLGSDRLPPRLRRVLEIRQALAKGSWKKYQAALDCTCADGRARWLEQYHGATTGRWAGRLIQPQNLRRPVLGHDLDELAEAIKMRDLDFLEMVYGDPMEVLADCVRGIFVAEEGKTLVAGDFSAIEAVVTAALAGEEWKLDVFRRGEDPYCVTAQTIFGHPVTKKEHPEKRQVGKICELAFGYQGGVGAWRQFDKSDRHTDEQVDGYKRAWREKHSQIVALWRGLNDAAVAAVALKKPHSYRGIEYRLARDGEWLTCRLLSGRLLWYYQPTVEEQELPWEDDFGGAATAPGLCYWARKNGVWTKVRAYGGLLTENVVQATARDLLVKAMLDLEAAGYPVVLHVHDEAVCEVDEAFASTEAVEEIMADIPEWAHGWPVKVEAWAARRYRK